MQDLKKNHKKEEEQPLCSLCQIEDDTTEHVFGCGGDRDGKQRNIKNNAEEEWEEVVQIFRKKQKKKRRKKKVQEERSSLDLVVLCSCGHLMFWG